MAELEDDLMCVFVCQENSDEQEIQQVLNIEDKVLYFQELEKLQQGFQLYRKLGSDLTPIMIKVVSEEPVVLQ